MANKEYRAEHGAKGASLPYHEKRVGIYARLSREDSRSGESVSIENQKLLLLKHVQEMGWELVEIYQDDGFSGTNQNRPALQRLLQDVKDGHINTVLIKDLSRLGRNYLEVGNLAEVFLPEHNCELISLNEKLDEMAVFRNWFNELHSRSTSNKVRAVKRMCAQDGKFGGAFAPFGYIKSPENKHKLIPDELAAPIIRKIFELRASGLGYNALARRLNEEGITSPRDYYYQQRDSVNQRREAHCWTNVTVKGLILNEVYIGHMVSMKQGTKSYKSPKMVAKPKEEWIRVENTHEPLIEMELWEKVQALAEKRHISRPKKDGERASIFSGLMVCADCGMRMRHATQRKTRKNGNLYEHSNFACGTYSRSGHMGCKPHIIGEKTVVEIVLNHIRSYAKMVSYDEERIIQNIVAQHTSESTVSKKTFDTELKSHNKRFDMLNKLIEKLYEDRITGAVPETVFKNLIQKYEEERVEKQQAIKSLESRMAELKENTISATTWARQIKQYTELEKLDVEILMTLIDSIIVSEAKVIDGERVHEIQIIYNHVGDVNWLGMIGKSEFGQETDETSEAGTGDKEVLHG
ncbi:MAG: recombinase family protein [Oscillospiraceae bacterium]|jgi:DNA invertase Pin-like site-specific DNA recombinase|nr:recombinase family protein [Oscillospiraceae bacterium]